MRIFDYFKSYPFFILPHHFISRITYRLTRIENRFVPQIIKVFSRLFKVNLAEAKHTAPEDYASFNAFFTRELAPDARQWVMNKSVLASPVDGTVSQVGKITTGKIIQAKGINYSVTDLLGGYQQQADAFQEGDFMTIYLSPRDYHRIHMPVDGTLIEQIYVPGRLFSVAPSTVNTISNLFTRNERLITLFKTEYGKMALILVGALNVAAIETVWGGLITPPPGKETEAKKMTGVTLNKGDEMGRFNMGSTVILLFEKDIASWDVDILPQQVLRLGQALAALDNKANHKVVADD